jgi:hypothetical protein
MKLQKTSLAAGVCLCVVAWCSRAMATDGFPNEADTHLGLAKGSIAKVAPPDGCKLCHVNGSAGGDPLTAFGTLMKANGAVKNQNATVGGALDAIAASQPRLIDDLKKGIDPNSDRDAGTDVNARPVPQYGCGSVSGRKPDGGALWLVVGAILVRVARRRYPEGS